MTQEQLHNISITGPIGPAIEKVKSLLFRPFDLDKWFTIGFCAWLAYLINAGGCPGFNWHLGRHNNWFDKLTGNDCSHYFHHTPAEFLWLLPLIIIGAVLLIPVGLVLLWLSSRGHFMFLHCVARNKSEVKIPWNNFRRHANSLFLLRVVLAVLAFFTTALFALAGVLVFIVLKTACGLGTAEVIIVSVITAFFFVPVMIAFLLISKFTIDFVVPIMFLRTTSCLDAWRQFAALLATNKVSLVLYILFQFVISIAIAAIVAAGVFMTCCCACCFLAIPYIGTVLILPLLIFKRAYSLYYLRQFGPAFDALTPQNAAAA